MKTELLLSRYLTNEKFSWLEKQNGIFFRRVDLFEDLYELSIIHPNLRRLPYSPPEFALGAHSIEKMNKTTIAQDGTQGRNADKSVRRKFYISSWTSRRTESYAMWRIYADGNGYIIQAKEQDLLKQITEQINILNERNIGFDYVKLYYGQVCYCNDDNCGIIINKHKSIKECSDTVDDYTLRKIFHKKEYYDFEEEYRFVIFCSQSEMPKETDLNNPKYSKDENGDNLIDSFIISFESNFISNMDIISSNRLLEEYKNTHTSGIILNK